MSWIRHSIRNKLLLISATGAAFLLAASLLGLWLALSQIQTLEQEVAAYQNAGQATQAALPAAKAQNRQTGASARRVIIISLGLMAAAMVMAFFSILWLVQRHVLNPVNLLVQDLDRLAKGDFSSAISSAAEDELGKIAASAEQVRINLGGIIAKVRNITEVVYSTVSRLSDTTSLVASGSTPQNEAGTTTTNEPIDARIGSGEGKADPVDENPGGETETGHTVNDHEKLSELTEEIAASLSEFNRSTEAISHMTRQIKDIAGQANLLALNAAIEGARAGEPGQGFAVVADEVRKLAERSEQSASQIDKSK